MANLIALLSMRCSFFRSVIGAEKIYLLTKVSFDLSKDINKCNNVIVSWHQACVLFFFFFFKIQSLSGFSDYIFNM